MYAISSHLSLHEQSTFSLANPIPSHCLAPPLHVHCIAPLGIAFMHLTTARVCHTWHALCHFHTSNRCQNISACLWHRRLSNQTPSSQRAHGFARRPQVIGATKGNNPARILEEVRAVGKELVRAFPTELTVGNMVRRILFIIREEYETCTTGADSSGDGGLVRHQPSLGNVLEGEISLPDPQKWAHTMPPNFKQTIHESIKELVQEIEGIQDQIADQAMEHIHANEVILTSNYRCAEPPTPSIPSR